MLKWLHTKHTGMSTWAAAKPQAMIRSSNVLEELSPLLDNLAKQAGREKLRRWWRMISSLGFSHFRPSSFQSEGN